MQTTLPTPVIAVAIAQLLIIGYVGANVQHFPRYFGPMHFLFALLCVGVGAWDHFQRQGEPRQTRPDRGLLLIGIYGLCIPTYHLVIDSPGLRGLPDRFRYTATAFCICAVISATVLLVGICLSDVSQYYHRDYTPIAKDTESQIK